MEEAATAESFFLHAGHLGSVVLATDESGAVAAEYAYDAYGRASALLDGVDQPYAFTGREWDRETGLYYYRARYYDPESGRFLSQDPIGFAGGDANLYRYVQNNPVNFVDPWGLQAQIPAPALPWPLLPPLLRPIPLPVLPPWVLPVLLPLFPSPAGEGSDILPDSARPICRSNADSRDEDNCYEQCKHLLPSPSGDLQSSEYRECFRRCMGSL